MAETSGFKRRVFVVMPFGQKAVPKKPKVEASAKPEDDKPLLVDFDAVYQSLLKPALDAAGLQPFRADDEEAAGDILKDMFAELVTADFVVADISILNANVFYELGIRHMVGPGGTICLHAGWSDRPFDVAPQRTFRYEGRFFEVGCERNEAWKKQVVDEAARLGEVLRRAVEADHLTEGSPVYGNLPNLVPPDVSGIGTAKFKHYRAQSEEWKQRVVIAGKEGRAEDILTLAGDAPSPYYRRKLLRQCGDGLLALGRFSQAEKIFKELCEDLDGTESLEKIRVKCQLALIANRLGRTREAEQKLGDLAIGRAGDPEVQGLLGRVYKDMWRTAWMRGPELKDRLALAQQNATLARKSLASYEVAVRRDISNYYNGINVVALATLLAHIARETQRPPRQELADLEELNVLVRLAASAKLEVENETVWARATLGELFLLHGESFKALDQYEQATADPDLSWFTIRSMLEQVQLFQLLGFQPDVVTSIITLLQQKLDERSQRAAHFDKIAICSGHMIDAPDRTVGRFPESKAEGVRARIAVQLAEWKIGPGDLAVCGGACGADILFAEECLRRGAKIRLLLAQEVSDFVSDSVQEAGSDWVQRFHALLEKSDTAIQPERLGLAPKGVSVYTRNNLWIVNTARVEAATSQKCHALLVWDGRGSPGEGGATDMAASLRGLGGSLALVNPEEIT